MLNKLAINGGTPVRTTLLQYGKQTIDNSDKMAVLDVLDENKYLTQGPLVEKFEDKVKEYCGAKYAVAVNSGTAALHLAVDALNLKSTDEIIVTCISFVASSNAILYCGVKPVFCDVEEGTLNIDPNKIEKLITNNTKAIMVVDFAGQPCNYHKIKEITQKYNLKLIEDAAHSIGCTVTQCPKNTRVGSFADLTTFSFHPVKNITTCEGGMVVTNNEEFYNKMMVFRTHGITKDYKQREDTASHYYEMISLGYNYRICDLLCALGINQLKRLDEWIVKRQNIAKIYDKAFEEISDFILPLTQTYSSANHIYIIKLNLENLSVDRDTIFKALKAEGIGVNVHYLPIHLHPYYKENLKTSEGMLPVAEKVYKQIITLPIFPTLTDIEIDQVIKAVKKVISFYKNELP
jgi:perosamine synthetase